VRQVRLLGTDLRSSVLGFGCASLMARLGPSESLRILEAAYDAGITHFDVARSYGYGEAEKVLGDFLSTKRDKVTVVTKFGILPPRRSTGLSVVKAIARKLVVLSPGMRRVLRARAAKMVAGGRFTVQDAKSSLDASLRELRTDYVDVLLLHECNAEDLDSEGLLDFLEGCVKDGKIRRFGIATDPYSTERILRSYKSFTSVIQLRNSVLERNLKRLSPHARSAVITHSAIGAGLNKLHKHVSGSAERVSRWSDAVGEDCSSLSVISGLMLGYAVRANTQGVVIFSSQDERHVRSNVASISDGTFSGDQVECFSNLVMRDFASIESTE
jgi:D-threo-aldose 1-dehydrogenase